LRPLPAQRTGCPRFETHPLLTRRLVEKTGEMIQSRHVSFHFQGARMMPRRGRSLVLTLAVLLAFWLIWSRLRFVVWVRAEFWQILLLFGVLALVLFLGLDHLLNRSR
ncbi:MAG: hypothetical protein D6775_14295, partial [Caldilineae bacterium]